MFRGSGHSLCVLHSPLTWTPAVATTLSLPSPSPPFSLFSTEHPSQTNRVRQTVPCSESAFRSDDGLAVSSQALCDPGLPTFSPASSAPLPGSLCSSPRHLAAPGTHHGPLLLSLSPRVGVLICLVIAISPCQEQSLAEWHSISVCQGDEIQEVKASFDIPVETWSTSIWKWRFCLMSHPNTIN